MTGPLTYLPAYVGLFAALVLGIACNAFLDIAHGTFGPEVLIWAAVFAATLRVGYRQQGRLSEAGRGKQKAVLIAGGILCVVLLLPVWGLPRGGVYVLGVLQAGNNCVTTSRRQLHLGVLVSAVMVMFAATHYRADWTMLFYLVPYVGAVVFTLVAEQVDRRAASLGSGSLGSGAAAGQGLAIAAGTAVILLLAGALYAMTPQATWLDLRSPFGLPAPTGMQGRQPAAGVDGQVSGGGNGEPAGGGSDGGAARGDQWFSGSPWPSPAQMRAAAARPGMPQWQAAAIRGLADMSDWVEVNLVPLGELIRQAWRDFLEWLDAHRRQLAAALLALVVLALAVAAWLLLREARAGTWLRSRFDYLRLGLLPWHADGNRGACEFYRAMERLFDLRQLPREAAANPREYLALIARAHHDLRREATEMTVLFEKARYGARATDAAQLRRMRELYRSLFRAL